MLFIRCLIILSIFLATAAHAVGVEEIVVPDPDDTPLAVRVWYPNAADQPDQIRGEHLPLIIISHGTGGSKEEHEDTAQALALAGFVVAAISHTGDNYKDHHYVGTGKYLSGRPRHVIKTIDYMLGTWRAHQQLDANRIGLFGFSAGGFTALVIAGGEPDLTRAVPHCRERPTAWDCNYWRKNGTPLESKQEPKQQKSKSNAAWLHDNRVKAAVIAAPAIGYSFEPNGLAHVTIPIQVWHGEKDSVVDDSAIIIRRLLPIAPDYHAVAGAGHYSFMAPCGYGLRAIIKVMTWFGTEAICDDAADFDRERFHAIFNNEVVQFFSTKLH